MTGSRLNRPVRPGFQNHDDTTYPSTSSKPPLQFTQSKVSINDIVRESSSSSSMAMATSFGQDKSAPHADQISNSSNASNARTLKRCVNVHARINVQRENWGGVNVQKRNFALYCQKINTYSAIGIICIYDGAVSMTQWGYNLMQKEKLNIESPGKEACFLHEVLTFLQMCYVLLSTLSQRGSAWMDVFLGQACCFYNQWIDGYL